MAELATMQDRDPWEKQPGESPQAYDAWLTYRDAGPSRSLRRLAADCGKTESWASDLSRRWRWQDRLDAWLVHAERERQLIKREAQAEAERENAIAGRALKGKGLAALPHIRAEDLTPADAARFIETGARIEGLALGLASEITGKALAPSQAEIVALVRNLVELSLSFIDVDRHAEYLTLARAVTTATRDV